VGKSKTNSGNVYAFPGVVVRRRRAAGRARPTPAQKAWLTRGLGQPGGKLTLSATDDTLVYQPRLGGAMVRQPLETGLDGLPLDRGRSPAGKRSPEPHSTSGRRSLRRGAAERSGPEKACNRRRRWGF
jgi:hypothetical protein